MKIDFVGVLFFYTGFVCASPLFFVGRIRAFFSDEGLGLFDVFLRGPDAVRKGAAPLFSRGGPGGSEGFEGARHRCIAGFEAGPTRWNGEGFPLFRNDVAEFGVRGGTNDECLSGGHGVY